MIKPEAGRLRGARPWLIPLLFALAGSAYLLLAHESSRVGAAGVVELSKDLISTSGLMIAFTGIIFTGMLHEIRSRTDRALLAGDHTHVERLERTSKALRRSALVSFLFFAASLGDAVGNLPDALASPASTFSLSDTFVVPVSLLIGGLVALMVALILIASE